MPDDTMGTDVLDDVIAGTLAIFDRFKADGARGAGADPSPRFATKDATGAAVLLEGTWEDHFADAERDGDVEIDGQTVPLIVAKATEGGRGAQIARVKRHHISIKDVTAVDVPKKWREAGLTSADFADPVNHKLPIHDADHVRDALTRWTQIKDDYSPREQAVIERRLRSAARRFGIDAASIQKKDFADATQRAVVMGLDLPDGFETPERPVEHADDPAMWGDFRSYRYPMATKEATIGSLHAIAEADDLDPEERATILLRLNSRSLSLLGHDIQTKQDEGTGAGAGAGAAADAGGNDAGDGEDDGEDDGADDEDQDDAAVDGRAALIAELGLALAAAYRSLSELSMRGGNPGIQDSDKSNLKKQFLAGLDAIWSGQADDDIPLPGDGATAATGQAAAATYEAKTIQVKEAAPALWPSIVTKVGRRHSRGDSAALARAHDAIVEAGYQGCQPATDGTMQTKSAPLVADGQPPATDPSVNALIAQLTARQAETQAEVTRLNALVDERASEVLGLQDAVADRDEHVREYRAQLVEADVRIADLEQGVAVKDGRIAELEDRMGVPRAEAAREVQTKDAGAPPPAPPAWWTRDARLSTPIPAGTEIRYRPTLEEDDE